MKCLNELQKQGISLMVCGCLLFGTCAVSASSLASLGPCLNEQTVALVRLEVQRVDVDALVDLIEVVLGKHGGELVLQQAQGDLENFRKHVGQSIQNLKAAGGQELYAIFNLMDLPRFVIAVPIPPAADREAMLQWVQEEQKNFHVGRLKTHPTDTAILVGLESSVNLLLASTPQVVPIWKTALATCEDTTLQLVMAPNADQRRVLAEMIPSPQLPGADILSTLLTQGPSWMSLGVNGPPNLRATLTVQAKDASQAQGFQAWIEAAYAFVAQHPEFKQRVPQLEALIRQLTPQQKADRLVLDMNQSAANHLIDNWVGLWFTQARGTTLQYACGTNMSGIGKAVLIYANDHEDRLPPNLDVLITACEMSPQGLVCPAVKTKDSYVYRGKDLTCAHMIRMVVAYDRVTNHINQGRRNVLFLDSRVEWMTEADFRKAIEEDNTYRRQKGLPVLPVE
jgi:hypothetical protein